MFARAVFGEKAINLTNWNYIAFLVSLYVKYLQEAQTEVNVIPPFTGLEGIGV